MERYGRLPNAFLGERELSGIRITGQPFASCSQHTDLGGPAARVLPGSKLRTIRVGSGGSGQDARLVGPNKPLRAGELFAEDRIVAVSNDCLKGLNIFLQDADIGLQPRHLAVRCR